MTLTTPGEFFDKKVSYMEANISLMLVSIFFSLIYMVYMRWQIYKMAAVLDNGTISPADFTLMGTEIYFDSTEDYDKEKMEQIIKKELLTRFEADVEYINPCFKIDKFYKWIDKQINMSKLKTLVEAYCEKNSIDKDSFDGANHPDAPKWPGKCCRAPVVMSDLDQKLKEVNEDI
jgi:hypothetical protein